MSRGPIAAQDAHVFRLGSMINDQVLFGWGELIAKFAPPGLVLVADTYFLKNTESSDGMRGINK